MSREDYYPALKGKWGMAGEKKWPRDSEGSQLQDWDIKEGDSSCRLGQLPSEGCLLPKANLGLRCELS